MKQRFSLLFVIVLTAVLSMSFIPGNLNDNTTSTQVKQGTDEINGAYGITSFVYYGSDLTGNFSRYVFSFYKWWNRVEVFSNDSETDGKWYYNGENGLDLDFGQDEMFAPLNGTWVIKEQDDSHFVLMRQDDTIVEFRLK